MSRFTDSMAPSVYANPQDRHLDSKNISVALDELNKGAAIWRSRHLQLVVERFDTGLCPWLASSVAIFVGGHSGVRP